MKKGETPQKDHLRTSIQFFKTDIWRIPTEELSRFRALLLGQVKIILMAIRRFDEDRCHLRASALTFYTVLSIVPVFAMAFGIAKGFALNKTLEKRILESFAQQQEATLRLIEYADNLLRETRGGLMAGIGVIALLWAVIKILGNIEASFNDIWKIQRGRSIGRKFTDYLSVVLVAPLLIIFSSSITITISSQITEITKQISYLEIIGPLILFGLNLLPYTVIWILFTFTYIFIPNTKVRFSSALYGGIIAGTIYQVVQLIYVGFQIGVAKYGAIYGSFAALPFFLIWIQLSWLIVLFGTELSFAFQYRDLFSAEYGYGTPSRYLENLVCLRIVHLVVEHFEAGKMAISEIQIAEELGAPATLMRRLIQLLISAEILEEVKEKEADEEIYYLPVKDPDILTVEYVLTSIERQGDDQIPVAQTAPVEKILHCLQEFENMTRNSPANIRLKEIKVEKPQ